MRRRETWALQKKVHTWYLVWTVPQVIRDLPMFGGRRLYTKTLETGDLREAQRKRDIIVASFDRLVSQAEEAPKRQRFHAYIEEIQKTVREAEGQFEWVKDPDGEDIQVPLKSYLDGYDLEPVLERGEHELADAIQYVIKGNKRVKDKYAITLKEAVKAFTQAEKAKAVKGLKPVAAATLSKMKHGAEHLAGYFGKDVPLKSIERRDVTLWLESLAGEKADKTRQGYVAALSLVWEARYLSRDVSSDNPFRSVGFKSTGDQQSYEQFTLEELAAIVELATPELRQLVKFGLVTGCRLGEIVGLREDDFEVSQGVHLVRIRAGKTASSIRAFPLPLPLWDELKDCATGRLWPSPEGKLPSATWSQYFGKLKKKATGARDRTKGFHSLRGMTITAYQRAEVPEEVTAPLMGHGTKGLTLSYGLYSSGYDYSHQLKAVETMLASPFMTQFLSLFK